MNQESLGFLIRPDSIRIEDIIYGFSPWRGFAVCDEVLATNDSLAMSASTLDFYRSKNISNLSIALSQEISDPAKDIYTGSKMDR